MSTQSTIDPYGYIYNRALKLYETDSINLKRSVVSQVRREIRKNSINSRLDIDRELDLKDNRILFFRRRMMRGGGLWSLAEVPYHMRYVRFVR